MENKSFLVTVLELTLDDVATLSEFTYVLVICMTDQNKWILHGWTIRPIDLECKKSKEIFSLILNNDWGPSFIIMKGMTVKCIMPIVIGNRYTHLLFDCHIWFRQVLCNFTYKQSSVWRWSIVLDSTLTYNARQLDSTVSLGWTSKISHNHYSTVELTEVWLVRTVVVDSSSMRPYSTILRPIGLWTEHH